MTYKFKRQTKVYLQYGSIVQSVPVYQDLTYNQTYSQQQYNRRTLHRTNKLYMGGLINRANQATFSFTTPVIINKNPIYLQLALDIEKGNLKPFNLYIQHKDLILKIQKACIQSLVFNLQRSSVSTVSITGSGANMTQVNQLPSGALDFQNLQYLGPPRFKVNIGENILENIQSVSIQVNNSIQWIPNDVVSYTNTVPRFNNFNLSQVRISGTIQHYLLDDNTIQFSDDSAIQIQVLDQIGPVYDINLTNTTYTAILSPGTILSKVYTFRANSGQQNTPITFNARS